MIYVKMAEPVSISTLQPSLNVHANLGLLANCAKTVSDIHVGEVW